jgi:hypothetical protein
MLRTLAAVVMGWRALFVCDLVLGPANERFAWPIAVVTLVLLTSVLHSGRVFDSPPVSV